MKGLLQFKPFKERQNTSFYLKMTIHDIRTDIFLKISELLIFNLYFLLVYNASHHLYRLSWAMKGPLQFKPLKKAKYLILPENDNSRHKN